MIPPQKIKNSRGPKRTITSSKNEIKKLFLGEEIKQKETQMGPHRGSQDDPATGEKIQGSKKDNYQPKIEIKFLKNLGEEIKQKETQMGPHRGSQDDPATGDKNNLIGSNS